MGFGQWFISENVVNIGFWLIETGWKRVKVGLSFVQNLFLIAVVVVIDISSDLSLILLVE